MPKQFRMPEEAATKVRRLARTPECDHSSYMPGEPRSYIAWHNWASTMSKFFDQLQCEHCQLYLIWRPKMDSIDCTELFVNAVQARAVVDAGGNVAVAVIRPEDHESPMISFEMKVDKLNNFLEQCRRAQGK